MVKAGISRKQEERYCLFRREWVKVDVFITLTAMPVTWAGGTSGKRYVGLNRLRSTMTASRP